MYPKVFEIPFTSDNKFHLTIHRKTHKDGGLTLHIKGAPEVILGLCNTFLHDGMAETISDKQHKLFYEAYATMAQKGHRVLAFAQSLLPGSKFPDNFRFSEEKKNWPAVGYCLLGLVSLEDPPKDGVLEAVQKMRKSGIKVIMITGDHALTAEAIARRVGILTYDTKQSLAKRLKKHEDEINDGECKAVIMSGNRLSHLSQADWDEILLKDEIVFARTSPKQKLEIVSRAQSMGHIVGVTGDGVNDAPALRQSDLGIAMNKSGSDISKDAAKMILLDDEFKTIASGILEGFLGLTLGRLIFINLKKCIQYSLTHIIPEVLPYLLFVLVPIPLTLTAIQILVVDLGFEIFNTISFAWEVEEYEGLLLSLPPRRCVSSKTVLALRESEEEIRRNKLDNPTTGSESLGSLPLLSLQDDDNEEDQAEFAATQTRWQRYFGELKLMATKRYWINQYKDWKALVRTDSLDERLVDGPVLCWSYLEGGMILFGGAIVSFFHVLYAEWGIDIIDAIRAQKFGKLYFRYYIC